MHDSQYGSDTADASSKSPLLRGRYLRTPGPRDTLICPVAHAGKRDRVSSGPIRNTEHPMAYDDTQIVEHIHRTHDTDRLSEREKQLIGLAVTMTRGCQVCTRNRIEKAHAIGLTDEDLNALVAVTSAVNSGVTAATARVAFGMLDNEAAENCGDVCSPNAG
ncbi:Carboxymuconolactone decarboxylase family protein [Maioricimonas rarisocia]|uniref:Carboxymuconolactone decarboxylase family protein n=1 Tax=Maioricimonas rarisocia TaxID=2528026 RepID=A0A517Z0J6_9PLAN|nr:carboxymuconolactone decarboxylase family protein [Maioricimonas rarisocia]QDU35998.1 Carboxymuconolactone decarboxylase family protein [Maioricimonas rarisocia]